MKIQIRFRQLAAFASLSLILSATTASAVTFKVLYAFSGKGNDGKYPQGSLLRDASGNLYGTASQGGRGLQGTVFKLSPDLKLTVLHAFRGSDGSSPSANLIADSAGNLYGTTADGGVRCSFFGCGTVFKLSPGGTHTVLYAFKGNPSDGAKDGSQPFGGLALDGRGNLYGTTESGFLDGNGIVFKIKPNGTERLYHKFQTYLRDGENSVSSVTFDAQGNLFGTTSMGGDNGVGTVFRIAPDKSETLFSLKAAAIPYANVIADQAGNLYGTSIGGGFGCDCGTIYKVSAGFPIETVLYVFKGGTDGQSPRGELVRDAKGDLFGTTSQGSGSGCGGTGCGTIFRLKPDGTFKTLHIFKEETDGGTPDAGLIMDADGNLYGTASSGGPHGSGTIFELTP
ncbi:MAG TPA: choice-of-anchor tandem repeat GloVer-containing protein [Rhizomicrobium sp.]|jgi:uncharacterized repeat protein (TIGR03803 family)